MTKTRRPSKEKAKDEELAHLDRGWRIAQLATDLYRAIPADYLEEHVPEFWSVDGIQNDSVFMGCLRRAELLYDTAQGTTGTLHAAELFEESKGYSINEITKIFRRYKFPNFSEGKLRPWLVQVHKEAKRLWLWESLREGKSQDWMRYDHDGPQSQDPDYDPDEFDKMKFLQDLVELTEGPEGDGFKERFPRKSPLLAALHHSTRPAGKVNMGDILENCRALSLYSDLLVIERRKLVNPPHPEFREHYPRLITNAELILHYSEFLGLIPDSPWWVQAVGGKLIELGQDMVCPECGAECDRAKNAKLRPEDKKVELGKRELMLRFWRIRVDCPQHGARDVSLPDVVQELKSVSSSSD